MVNSSCGLVGCLLVLLSFSSCGPIVIYEAQQEVDPNGWGYADSIVFSFEVEDTIHAYDLVLEVSHSETFSYENLYTLITTHFPDGRSVEQQLSLELTDQTASWLGNCRGQWCTLAIPIAEQRRFKKPGSYAITIHQHSQAERLEGVGGLELSVQRPVE